LCIRRKRVNVFAFIVGLYSDYPISPPDDEGYLVTYNPYKYESFVFANTDEPVYNAGVARCVTVDGKGCIFV
jgi:hypothetical protein